MEEWYWSNFTGRNVKWLRITTLQILQPVSDLVHSTGDIQINCKYRKPYYGNIKENMDTTL